MAKSKRKSNSSSKTNGSRVALSEAQSAAEDLISAVRRSRKGVGDRVQSEINRLVAVVARTRSEIVDLKPEEIPGWRVEEAQYELDAVIKHTEDAAESFMAAAEELEQLADDLPKKKAAQIRDVTTRIFEASTFQDISGQRLVNAKRALGEIDGCVVGVLTALGHSVEADREEEPEIRSDADLLHGPQHAEDVPSQEDIDALLASFD